MPERRRYAKIIFAQAASIALFLAVWEYAVRSGAIPSIFLSPPSEIARNFFSVLSIPLVRQKLPYGLAVTVLTFGGVLAGGVVTGLLIGSNRFVNAVFQPFLVLIYSVPRSVLVVVFWVFFGLGFFYQFWFGFLSGMLPIALNTIYALHDIDPSYLRVAHSMGASESHIFTKIVLPSVVPSILSGARIAFNLTFGAILIAQEFVGTSGIGYLVIHYTDLFASTQLDVIVVVTALFGMAFNMFLLLLERRLTRWNIKPY
ncbi:MAG: ABC transporter permease subunit [Nitrososphaerota archaeon]|jgi:NitT/TauT family transport system permease protein|nr:ABC transporter permease subunit [Nitrososphaerota archaeon]